MWQGEYLGHSSRGYYVEQVYHDLKFKEDYERRQRATSPDPHP